MNINKSPEINGEFNPNLLRGLSTLLENPFPSLDAKPDPTNQATNLELSSEKTYDLQDFLYQQQKTTNSSVFAQLEPVRMAELANNMNQQQQQQNALTTSLAVSECSMDSQGSSLSSSSSAKRKFASVETDTMTAAKSTPNKRGRKPTANSQSTARSKFGKHELITEDNAKKTLVFFGNKKVEIGTDEYKKRRENNNEAVKKCREKMEREQKEREQKMTDLVEVNRKLSEKMSAMSKEMEVLKSIILSMRPDKKMPENIQHVLNDL